MILTPLEKTIGYSFKNKNFLKEALTHRSYLNENPSWELPHNERLEFLGDAVLELIITEELFNRFPDKAEGELTTLRASLVNYQILAEIAASIFLDNFILLSRGEAKDTGRGRAVILANAFEALIGAIYLDADYKAAKIFIIQFVLTRLDDVMKGGLVRDPKSMLQEKTQGEMKITPTYKVISETGPDHAKRFEVGVYIGDKLVAQGSGESKHEAELQAAKKALETL